MGIMEGFENLQAKDILSIEGGVVMYVANEKVHRRQLTITPSGSLSTREIDPVPVDQTEREGLPDRVPVAQRWAGTDQMQDGRPVQ